MRENCDKLLSHKTIFDNCINSDILFSHGIVTYNVSKAKAMMKPDESVLTKCKLGHIYHKNKAIGV